MANRIPNDIVVNIISFAIKSAHYQQGARLALVNKNAYAVYKNRTDIATSIIKDVIVNNRESSNTFKVCMKVLQGRKIAFSFKIDKQFTIEECSTNRQAMFTAYNSTAFYKLLEKMVCTPNLRDVRVQVKFNNRDNDTIMPYVSRFIKYMISKCVRA
jgi:hypothetical protein